MGAGALLLVEGGLVSVALVGWLIVRAAREGDERQELVELAWHHVDRAARRARRRRPSRRAIARGSNATPSGDVGVGRWRTSAIGTRAEEPAVEQSQRVERVVGERLTAE